MRALAAAVPVVLLLAGCLSGPPATTDEPATIQPAPEPMVTEQDVSFGQPLAGPAVVGGSTPFDVPAAVHRLTADARWSCVSLCKIQVDLVAPDGMVAASTARGNDAFLEVTDPAPGTWSFSWAAAEGASIGIDGTVHLTYEMAA